MTSLLLLIASLRFKNPNVSKNPSALSEKDEVRTSILGKVPVDEEIYHLCCNGISFTHSGELLNHSLNPVIDHYDMNSKGLCYLVPERERLKGQKYKS